MARYFLIKHRMLPIDVQRKIVFAFKTDAISELRRKKKLSAITQDLAGPLTRPYCP